MNDEETAKAVDARAAAWVARLDRGDVDERDRARLQAWLDGDARRRGAYLRAQAASALLDRAGVLAGGAGEQEMVQPMRRRMLLGAGVAATALLTGTAALAWAWPPAQRFDTATGEIRWLPLGDGSIAVLNTDTRLRVLLERERRRIWVERGEAWFRVAPDPARPFIVAAGATRVRALGTAFAVRRVADGSQVQVTEGRVEVGLMDAGRDAAGAAGRRREVAAGSRVFADELRGPGAVVATPAGIDRSLAWRTGELIFEGDALSVAAAEFNRYNRTRLVVTDAALAQKKVSGRFRTSEPDAFARAAASLLELRVHRSRDAIVLTRE